MLTKVISGGQTGVDRAALEAAVECGIETGGFAPPGFITSSGQDLSLRDTFKLEEFQQNSCTNLAKMYIDRSKANVDMADATLAFRFWPSVGTDKTIQYCKTGKWPNGHTNSIPKSYTNWRHKPFYIVTDLNTVNLDEILEFLHHYNVRVLNVAGHRDINIKEPVKLFLIKLFNCKID